MWTKPRATIQQIVDTNPEHLVMILAAISGFSQVLSRASMRSMGDELAWPFIFLIAAIAGPIGGIIGLYIASALIRWTGSWIGGNASSQNIRAALAWSSVPIIWALILWLPELALFGQELFTTETPIIDANPSLVILMLGFAAIELSIGIWTAVVFLKCLGQVQGFSAWKALGNAFLAGIVIVIPIAVIVFGLVGLNTRTVDEYGPSDPAIASDDIYLLEHRIIPDWTHNTDGEFFADLLAGNYERLRAAAAEVVSNEFAESITIEKTQESDGVLIKFPEPTGLIECYFAYVTTGKNVGTYLYFTYEKTEDEANRGVVGVIGGWSQDLDHIYYGPRTYSDADSFVFDVREISSH